MLEERPSADPSISTRRPHDPPGGSATSMIEHPENPGGAHEARETLSSSGGSGTEPSDVSPPRLRSTTRRQTQRMKPWLRLLTLVALIAGTGVHLARDPL